MLRGEDCLSWAVNLLRMQYVVWVHFKAFFQAQPIKLSTITKLSTAVVRREKTVTDTVQNSLSYEQTFKEDLALHLVAVRIFAIVVDMMSSKFLADNSRVAYVGYIRIRNQIRKHNDALRSLIDLCKDAPATMTLGVMHPDDPSLCISYEVEILLII